MQLKPMALATGLLFGACALGPAAVDAQAGARVRLQENFRREPNGVVLAVVLPGAELRVLGQEGNWTEVVLTGWVWLRSLQSSDDAAFDLVVSETGGENVRGTPSGRILAHLEEGALLSETERNDAWARVTRRGWVWTASLELGVDPPPPVAQTGGSAVAGPAARSPGGFASVGAAGGPILTAPDGDTLAHATAGSDVQVLGREGSWVRVRVEGWMWRPVTADAASPVDEAPSALEPSDLVADPVGHTGRVVSWTVQFISLERAEALRTDFFQGEPFLLTRFDGGDGPFVYVAVPSERLAEVEGLVPLERVSITGRVRTGASALTGVPIVDLLAIERSRQDR